jgi:hypothetical protein
MKVWKSCPHCFHKLGEGFSADPGVSMRIAKRAIFRESLDKCARVMTVPGVDVAAHDFGGFHSRNLVSALCAVERELGALALHA